MKIYNNEFKIIKSTTELIFPTTLIIKRFNSVILKRKLTQIQNCLYSDSGSLSLKVTFSSRIFVSQILKRRHGCSVDMLSIKGL